MIATVALTLATVHGMCRLKPAKGTPTPPPPSPSSLPPAQHHIPPPPIPCILVTGACGLVGTSILQQLAKTSHYKLIGADLFSPKPNSPRSVATVTYIELNLAQETVSSLAEFINAHKINCIVNTAGVVFMKDDKPTLQSVNHFASTNLLLAAKHCTTTVSAFVLTSSASTVNNGQVDNLNIDPLTIPADPVSQSHCYSTDYGRTKAAAELDVLAANSPPLNFHTLALRLPGVYGHGDPWMGGPLSRGELTHLPGSAGKRVEMVYVENVAHAHVCACATLLGRNTMGKVDAKVGGRAYHVTNNEPQWTMGGFVEAALERYPANAAPAQLGNAMSMFICCFVEGFWWFTQGNVFAARHPVWNFTRASLSYMSTDQTFSTAGNELIGYEPLFNVEASLDDMVQKSKR